MAEAGAFRSTLGCIYTYWTVGYSMQMLYILISVKIEANADIAAGIYRMSVF